MGHALVPGPTASTSAGQPESSHSNVGRGDQKKLLRHQNKNFFLKIKYKLIRGQKKLFLLDLLLKIESGRIKITCQGSNNFFISWQAQPFRKVRYTDFAAGATLLQGMVYRFRCRRSTFPRYGTGSAADTALLQGQDRFRRRHSTFARSGTDFVAGTALSQGQVQISPQAQRPRKVCCRFRSRRSTFPRYGADRGRRSTFERYGLQSLWRRSTFENDNEKDREK